MYISEVMLDIFGKFLSSIHKAEVEALKKEGSARDVFM